MIRLDFPGFSGARSLQPISWRQWFRQFDENNLALLVQEKTSRGQRSNFNKLVSRDSVDRRRGSERAHARAAEASRNKTSATRKTSGTRARKTPTGRTAARKAAARRKARTARAAAGSRQTGGARTRAVASGPSPTRRAGTTRPLTGHDQIRRWAEARSTTPACVKGTGGRNDTGMIRLDFPGFSGAKSLQPISWNEWFRQFDENNLALLVQETTSRGQRSNFNRLVSRDTVARRKCAAGRRRTTTRRATRSTRTAAGGRATRTSR